MLVIAFLQLFCVEVFRVFFWLTFFFCRCARLLMTFCHVVFAANADSNYLAVLLPQFSLSLFLSLCRLPCRLISTLLCYVITLKLVCVANFAHYAHPYAWPGGLHTPAHSHIHTTTCLVALKH